MKKLFFLIFISTILISCSSTKSQLKNSNNIDVSTNKDKIYLNKVKNTIIETHEKQESNIKKVNMKEILNTFNDEDLIFAGKLNCKVIEEMKPEDNKFEPTMPKVAKDMPYPLAYVKVKDFIDTKFKEPKKDIGYMSLNDIDQIGFLAFTPFIITQSILIHSTEEYCPESKKVAFLKYQY